MVFLRKYKNFMITKKIKIVVSIGPATTDKKVLTDLLNAGMNIARINFSHGDFMEHQSKVDNIRSVSKKTGIPVALLQDIAGPKIRIGDFYKESIVLKKGDLFTLTTKKIVGDEKKVCVNYSMLPKEVRVGGWIMLHDGKKKLKIVKIKEKDVVCRVVVGGEIKGRRGVNLPGARLSISFITEKDKKDLKFGIKNKVDFVALSFVRRADNVEQLRKLLKKAGSKAKIISKIEDVEGLENIDEIINTTDGIMIGRGDFGIEIGVENMPMIQKEIIKKCNTAGKPVITATHMLESMIKSPVPTRVEVSDIANAILDGTDAIMLSEETVLGQYPVEAVKVMAKVAVRVEKEMGYVKKYFAASGQEDNVTDAVSAEAVDLAHNIGAKYIVALTYYGFAARMIARYRPVHRVIAMTPNEKVASQLLLTFGCNPVLIEKLNTLPAAIKEAKKHCLKSKLAQKGDKIVIVAGMPFGKSGMTNTILVERI